MLVTFVYTVKLQKGFCTYTAYELAEFEGILRFGSGNRYILKY
jgi:hypothetical protein